MTRISNFGHQEYLAHQAKFQQKPVVTPVSKKRSKYGASRHYSDRIWFASKKELKRWEVLKGQQRRGEIQDLVPHPVFPLMVNDEYIGRYTADFRFMRDGVEIVEDVKSRATATKETFRRTMKIIAAQYGIEIQVVL